MRYLTRDLTRLPPRDSTLDGRWTRKPFGLSRVESLGGNLVKSLVKYLIKIPEMI